jgi:hypothetical protein
MVDETDKKKTIAYYKTIRKLFASDRRLSICVKSQIAKVFDDAIKKVGELDADGM